MKLSLLKHILTILCLGCCISSKAVQPAIPDTIPFEIGADKRIYVSAYINGQTTRPYRFLVDTGASSVVLNSSLKDVLESAEFCETVVNRGATSTETIPATDANQTLQIGRNVVKGLRFIAIAYPPSAWDGVLGLAFLREFDVVFNYDRKEMYLYTQGYAPKPDSRALPFEYRANVPVVTIAATIRGKRHKLHVELDSGSDRTLDINTPYVNKHELRGTLPVFAVSTIAGTSQEQGRLENVLLDEVKIGDVTFPLLPGAFSTLTAGLQSTQEFDGVIGNNLLQRFNQVWDFKNNKLYLSVNCRYYTPFYDFLVAQF